MSNNQNSFASQPAEFARKAVRLSALAVFAISASFAATGAMAAGKSDANAQYQAERAVCLSGQSNQDRATCLKEAGAALAEARRGRLTEGQGSGYSQNAMVRCSALPADDRDACQRRIQGQGTTSGTAESGGIIREVVTPVTK